MKTKHILAAIVAAALTACSSTPAPTAAPAAPKSPCAVITKSAYSLYENDKNAKVRNAIASIKKGGFDLDGYCEMGYESGRTNNMEKPTALAAEMKQKLEANKRKGTAGKLAASKGKTEAERAAGRLAMDEAGTEIMKLALIANVMNDSTNAGKAAAK